MEHFDVIIVGAGLSGIGAARQLQDKCPGRSFLILEAREAIGGTWDLFRYPGIRSDSDMYTMGYDSKPWLNPKAIADGPSILSYIREAAVERGIDQHIRFGHRVSSAAWSTTDGRWVVTAEHAGSSTQLSAGMFFVCSGYYRYEEGHRPHFEGEDSFTGPIIHPQHWPANLAYAGKRVIIVGSGATAMTLVPAMARSAAHVTMLQRTPTYVVSLPSEDVIARWLRRLLPSQLAYALTRWKNVMFQRYVYRQTRVNPEKVRAKLLSLMRKALGKEIVDRHFTPSYKPWDQRLCLVPDGDLFKAIRSGKAEVVTDTIARFTPEGIALDSGTVIPADIIVTATGLDLVALGNIAFSVDGRAVNFADTYSYKGMMFSGVPNLVYTLGYINASWTLRSELVAEFVCRLVNHLHAQGLRQCTPVLRENERDMPKRPLIDDFSPGYIQRAIAHMARQGDRAPWINRQNYLEDRKMIREESLEDGVLKFSNPPASHAAPAARHAA